MWGPIFLDKKGLDSLELSRNLSNFERTVSHVGTEWFYRIVREIFWRLQFTNRACVGVLPLAVIQVLCSLSSLTSGLHVTFFGPYLKKSCDQLEVHEAMYHNFHIHKDSETCVILIQLLPAVVLHAKPHVRPWRARTLFLGVWWNSLPHFGPTYQSVRCVWVKNVGRLFSQVVLFDAWLIGFDLNRRPHIVKSRLFQSSCNPSWAVVS